LHTFCSVLSLLIKVQTGSGVLADLFSGWLFLWW
jgi:hypothetical protein